ncbi:hypothetical protein [Psychrobacter fjordensis]|uniref:hypothetical protein n=1 Tax=Psychrobacter fjordensis TaxID=664424 RepID=UPI00191AE0D2|nr:hypothetical protein [Psychrobacter fjordensis]
MKIFSFLLMLSTISIIGCNNSSSEISKNNELVSNTSIASQSDIKILTCEPDYQPINYCTKKYTKTLNQEAKLPANFDENKRIVVTKIKMDEAKISKGSKSDVIYKNYFIVIDLNKHTATPLTEVLTNLSNKDGYLSDIKPKVLFDKSSNEICFTGSLISYRDAYENVDNACYTFDSENGFTSPANAPFEKVDLKYLKIIKNNNLLIENHLKEYSSTKSTGTKDKKSSEGLEIIFSMIDNEVSCKLQNCIQKLFDKKLYNTLFINVEDGPAGVMAGSYYDIENSYGLDIYAAGYTEEGEVDFDYIIVSNGNKTSYIELPMNSNYSITNNLVISGYSSTVSNFSYKIDVEGNIINSTS